MNTLPKWVLANPIPAIHDFESLTVLEQTARIYGAMNSLIVEYNTFADQVNKAVSEFTGTEENSRKEFENLITKVMREFQCSIEKHLVLNLDTTAAEYLNSAINEGRITLEYDPETENLNFNITGGEA